MGNADTLQQRARFFGYKRHYLGFCRVYLEAAVLSGFEAYVEHETEMRDELLELDRSGAPLTGWKRRFVLDAALRPCRNNVIQHAYVQGNYSNDWFFPELVVMDEGTIGRNRTDVEAFVAQLPLARDTSFTSRRPAQQHYVSDVPLQNLIDNLLLRYRVEAGDDTSNMLGVLLQLGRWSQEHPEETARVFNMRPRFASTRGVNDAGRITIGGLMQGRTDAAGADAYPGDRFFMDNGRVTLQIHMTDLTQAGQVVRTRVPIIALWIPARLGVDWLAQGDNR